MTIWNPKGVGTLNLLAVEECQAPSRTGNWHEFSGKLQGRTYDSPSGARYWKLLCSGRWIDVIYLCTRENAELERAQIDEILQSLAEAV
jgi:hypothetical protein